MSNLLKTFAKWMLFASAAVFVTGFCWIIAAAPCSNVGAYILISSIALTALSAFALLVRALAVRTAASVGLGAAVAFWGVVEFYIFAFTALMLCRGV
ncbi:hypothetical protein [Dyella sp. S184]|uniref:hypothetical protein n=1 Tax=Dyella sp. S184 TaxID=1641862 RepID=UPI00131CD0A5|nr:hypothetical protein [Dyella sp. S184]